MTVDKFYLQLSEVTGYVTISSQNHNCLSVGVYCFGL